MTMWTIITRHPNHKPGKWNADSAVYETKDQAMSAATNLGTGVQWKLMSLPGVEDYESLSLRRQQGGRD
jgi:hypothetical protein